MAPRISTARRVLGVLAMAVVLVVVGAIGWHWWTHRAQGEPQAIEFADAVLSDQLVSAKILALGEATHGTHEFQAARIDLVAKLADRGFTTIALEADYAGVRLADQWINGADGSVEAAVKALGFAIYQTRENAELLGWLRDYNASRPSTERLHLVGLDAQRLDHAKTQTFELLAIIDDLLLAEAKQVLADYTDDWTMTASDDDLQRCAEQAGEITAKLSARAHQHGDDTDTAIMLITQIEQDCRIRSSGAAYGRVRDAAMFTNLGWLVDRAPGSVIVFAHNGHVAKTRAGFGFDPQYRAMGELAAERWAADYRVIGTDYVHADVVARVADSDRFDTFSFTNRTPLRGIFTDTQAGFIEFTEANQANRELLNSSVQMGSVGERVQPQLAWLPMSSQVTMVPAHAYDGLILVRDATAVTRLPA